MQVDFKVGSPPPTRDEIQLAKERLVANERLGQKMIPAVGIVSVLMAFAAYEAIGLVASGSMEGGQAFESVASLIGWTLLKLMVTAAPVVGIWMAFLKWWRKVFHNARMLDPLDPEGAHRADVISSAFPEAKAYLDAVKSSRRLKNGDFWAVHTYARLATTSKD
ncbi:hypothetical protein ABIC83_002393 [Roseateles asaccharophilus]|uniref:hypothetical protein n=1 Tax=Roseateles asaccharophilus TaxID=582607 RepID=UPI003832C3C9